MVRVKVVTPDKLSDEQRRIFVELAGSLGQGKTGEQSGKKIMDRFKKGLK